MRRLPAASGQRAAPSDGSRQRGRTTRLARARWALLAALACAAAPGVARAESMDPVLSRFRIVSGTAGCAGANSYQFCKNGELFERVVSELGVALAPPLTAPAASSGPSGLGLALDMTVTSVDAGAAQWQSGTQAGTDGAPDPVLVWTRATLRKGLPFGFEVGAAVGRGHATSLWSLGLSVKWAIVEGFRSGAGALPDVAVQGSTTRSMGLDDLSIATHALDLILSKPLHVGGGYRIAPLLGAQLLFIEAESGMVDLTPGPDDSGPVDQTPEQVDAFGACRPGAPEEGEAVPLSCTGTGEDFVNNVLFDPVQQTRLRLFVGGQLQFGVWRFSASFGFDLFEPELEATRRDPGDTAPTLERQLAVSVAAGAVL